MSFPVCTITGTLFRPDGTPAPGAMVRVRLAEPWMNSGIRSQGAPVEGTARTVFTDNDGEFTVTLPQGSLSHWEIPVSCIFGLFASVPAASSASFESLEFRSEPWSGVDLLTFRSVG